MIKAVLVGDPSRITESIRSLFPEIKSGVGRSMARLVIALSNKIKFEKLTGQVLRNRSGRLRDSISPRVTESGNTVVGEVGTNVAYASIHEYGGRTPAHDIFPRKGRALAFMMGGKQVIVKSVHHPGSVFPERSFMRTALNEMEPQIRAEFENAISEVISCMRGAA